jgi:uncharacterized membrane protein
LAADRPGVLGERGDPALSDQEQHDVALVRHVVQWLLRIGLAISFVLMTVGLVMKLATGDQHSASVRLFELGRSMRTGDRLMAMGILVLAATPALRVVSLVVLWAWERDWRFVTVALVVVLTLASAIAIGHG